MKKERFPGFQECMRLMRRRDPQLQEDGYHLLLPHAHEYVQQLMEQFTLETDRGLRCWLLELLAEARESTVLPLFLEYLYNNDSSLKATAIRGLQLLNTKEARFALWEAGQ